jgi:hypothetical protein
MNLRKVDFEGQNLTRMAHDRTEAVLKLQYCCRIDSSNKKYYI